MMHSPDVISVSYQRVVESLQPESEMPSNRTPGSGNHLPVKCIFESACVMGSGLLSINTAIVRLLGPYVFPSTFTFTSQYSAVTGTPSYCPCNINTICAIRNTQRFNC